MIYRRCLIALGLIACSGVMAAATPANSKPAWDKISKAFDQYFAKRPKHHPQAIITQDDVEPLWNELACAGWKVPADERNTLMKLIPTEQEFFVRQLHTANGRRFMRTVAVKHPEVYGRLDQLARTAGGGKAAVSGLIAAPDAELTVNYMFSKGGEKSWAALLPKRQAFNKPTGRIYTAEELKKELQSRFSATH